MYCMHPVFNAGINSESLVWQPSRNPEGLDEGACPPCGGCGLGEDRQEEHPDYPSRGEPEEMSWQRVDRCFSCGGSHPSYDDELESYLCLDCHSSAGGANYWKSPYTGENP